MKRAICSLVFVLVVSGCGSSVAFHPTLKAYLRITRHVPCGVGNAQPAGLDELKKFKAVTAVECEGGLRVYPGHGEWHVAIRKVAVSGVGGLQRYYEQPDRPNWPSNGGCTLSEIYPAAPALVDANGRWIVPHTPVDRCGQPLGRPPGGTAIAIRWHIVSVRKIRQQISAPALAAGCDMRWGIELPGRAGGRAAGGPVFAVAPKTVHVCVYRTWGAHHDVGNFVRGFKLDRGRTARLLAALAGAGRGTRCPVQRTFAVVSGAHGEAAQVELGGCFRVARLYPTRGVGRADPTVIRSLLGSA
jgi:hypothetical protein